MRKHVASAIAMQKLSCDQQPLLSYERLIQPTTTVAIPTATQSVLTKILRRIFQTGFAITRLSLLTSVSYNFLAMTVELYTIGSLTMRRVTVSLYSNLTL